MSEALLKEALWHIAAQLDPGPYNVIGEVSEVPNIADRLPYIRQFALDMAEGGAKRPGFAKFIEHKNGLGA